MATWEPFDGFQALQREIQNAFERAMPQFHPTFGTAFLPGRAAREYPLVNLYEDQDNVHVEALAPQHGHQQIDVEHLLAALFEGFQRPAVRGWREL